MITVQTNHKRTGETTERVFKTELGAWEATRAAISDHTNVTLTIAGDAATLLCDKGFKVKQKRFGPLLFTITRTR